MLSRGSYRCWHTCKVYFRCALSSPKQVLGVSESFTLSFFGFLLARMVSILNQAVNDSADVLRQDGPIPHVQYTLTKNSMTYDFST